MEQGATKKPKMYLLISYLSLVTTILLLLVIFLLVVLSPLFPKEADDFLTGTFLISLMLYPLVATGCASCGLAFAIIDLLKTGKRRSAVFALILSGIHMATVLLWFAGFGYILWIGQGI